MKKILLVDDNPSYCAVWRDLCESAGYSVIETESAQRALTLLRCMPNIDLVMTDQCMLQMTGFELIRQMRSREETRHIPIILLTSSTKAIQDLLAQEGVLMLSKSVDTKELLSSIHKALESSRAKAAATPPAPPQAHVITQTHYENFVPKERSVAPSARPSPKPLLPAAHSLPAAKAAPAGGVPSLPMRRREDIVPSLRSGDLPSAPPPAAPVRPPVPAPAPRASAKHSTIEEKVDYLIAKSDALAKPGADAPPEIPGDAPSVAADDTPFVRLVDGILADAVEQRASDIHIEPQHQDIRVRVRVDGSMLQLCALPARMRDALVTRIKVIANLDIMERRLPQDGNFVRQTREGKTIVFRVSTLPSLYGEKVVMRLLRSEEARAGLDAVGLSERDLSAVRGALTGSSGLVLVTGPTGSGKTTSLYTMLDHLNVPGRNIITVEDPVEYRVRNITQVQTNSAIGYDFERVLRAMLRQDPDVVLVGEIRDAETAAIAAKAAATGHMVLSTLHTNSAPAALARLLSMGVPPYLVAASCRLIIAQRLVRLLCRRCRREDVLDAKESCALTAEECARLPRVWRAVGCSACLDTGYAGRRPVFEVMPIQSPEMNQAILQGADMARIAAQALKEGMQPLRSGALGLVAEGLTSPAEVLPIIHA